MSSRATTAFRLGLALLSIAAAGGCDLLLIGGTRLVPMLPLPDLPERKPRPIDARTAARVAVEIAAADACLERGDLAGAVRHQQRTFTLTGDRPGIAQADVQHLTGRIVFARGDLDMAEGFLGLALRLYEDQDPANPTRFRILAELGDVARRQGDLALAESRLLTALAAAEDGGYAVQAALVRAHLGAVALARGETKAAVALLRRVVADLDPVGAPEPLRALAWQRLGRALTASEAWEEAEAALARASDLETPAREHAWPHVETLVLRGDLARRRGQPARAEAYYRDAFVRVHPRAPWSVWRLEIDRGLAALAREGDRLEAASAFYEDAARALEHQLSHLGGSPEARVRFAARYADVYRGWEDLRAASGDHEGAFRIAERGRARVLLTLRPRRSCFLCTPTDEVRDGLKRADAEYDHLLARWATESDEVVRPIIEKALVDARLRQAEARARRRATNVYSYGGEAAPLDLDGVRKALPAGTLLLFYSLGPRSGRVYAVGPSAGELGVFDLPGEAAVRQQALRVREQIDVRRSPALQPGLTQDLARMGELLLGPVASRLERARRVMIVPDGVLHFVPFAALPFAGTRTLAEHVPSFVVPSVSFYSLVARPPARGERPLRMVGFGDPVYPGQGRALERSVADAVGCGLRLDPLPHTRRELEALALVAPGAEIWVGPSATEDKVKALPRQTDLVHIGSHGFVDESFPLESGLALTLPSGGEGDNGLLQAWEVLEDVRVDADLVTLSACGTALGREAPGEGVFGLTWAFHHAGARSVVASLWDVSDESTAELIRAFYAGLGAGLPKDAALRDAQLAVRSRPQWSAPYYWAGFHLSGARD